MEKLTIREIAKMAGVSQTAVSFVMNNKPGVSDETRQRVLDIIEETNFKANLSSRRLALSRNFSICLTYVESSSPFDDWFYFEVAKGVMNYMASINYSVTMLCLTRENGKYTVPDIIASKATDGIMFFQDIDDEFLHQIESFDIPYVVVDSYSDSSDILTIKNDAKSFTRKAIGYLLSRGHRSIGLIGSSYIPNFWSAVYESFVDSLRPSLAAINEEWIQNQAYDEDSAYDCMRRILNSSNLPTAVFCAGDIFAIGAIRCIKDSGLSVPNDISIISVDNISYGKYIEPALTTINLNNEQLGVLAAQLLWKRMNNHDVRSIKLDSSSIVERQSVITIDKPKK